MKTSSILIVAVGFAIVSCTRGQDADSSDEISGAYAREYSFNVINPETGNEIGMRTIRDTIFIRPVERGYEVANAKWKLNDFDRQGWQNMKHDEDRPLPAYIATFDRIENTLNSESAPPLYLNQSEGSLSKDKKGDNPYRKSR